MFLTSSTSIFAPTTFTLFFVSFSVFLLLFFIYLKNFLIEFPIEAILCINTHIYKKKKEQFNSDQLKPAECCIPRRRKCRKCRIPHMESRYNIHFATTQSFFSYIFSSCHRCCPFPAISTIEACFYVFERVHWQSDVNPSLLSDKNPPYRDISNPFSKRTKKKNFFFSSIFHFISFSFLFFLFFLFHFSTHNVQNKSGRPGELQGKEVSVYYSLFFSCVISNIYFYFFSFLFQFYVLQCASM